MNKEYNAALVIFVILTMAIQTVYVSHIKNSFMQDNEKFEQVGLMEYTNNGDVVYMPVFKKRNHK